MATAVEVEADPDAEQREPDDADRARFAERRAPE